MTTASSGAFAAWLAVVIFIEHKEEYKKETACECLSVSCEANSS